MSAPWFFPVSVESKVVVLPCSARFSHNRFAINLLRKGSRWFPRKASRWFPRWFHAGFIVAVSRNGWYESSGSFRRTGEIEAEFLFLGETHELPLIGKGPAVVNPQLVEDHAARLADTQRLLEQFHQLLIGKAAGKASSPDALAAVCRAALAFVKTTYEGSNRLCVASVGHRRVPPTSSAPDQCRSSWSWPA